MDSFLEKLLKEENMNEYYASHRGEFITHVEFLTDDAIKPSTFDLFSEVLEAISKNDLSRDIIFDFFTYLNPEDYSLAMEALVAFSLENIDIQSMIDALPIVVKNNVGRNGIIENCFGPFTKIKGALAKHPYQLQYERACGEVLDIMLDDILTCDSLKCGIIEKSFKAFFKTGFMLSGSKYRQLLTMERLLETEYDYMIIVSSINKAVESEMIETLDSYEKKRVIEDVLEYASGKPDIFITNSVKSTAEVLTTVAASIGDEEYTREIVARSKQIFPQVPIFGFINALKTISDEKFTLGFLEHHGNEEEIELNFPKLVRSKERLDRYLEFKERKEERLAVIVNLEDEALQALYLPECNFSAIAKDLKDPAPIYIGLPEDLRFGVEYEAEGYNPEIAKKLFRNIDTSDWEIKSEISLTEGTEVTSVEHFSDGKGLAKALKMAEIMEAMGFREEQTCGGHIHFGFDYFESDGTGGVKSLSNLIRIWKEAEEIIYKISNKEGELPREDVIEVADVLHASLDEVDTIENRESLNSILKQAEDQKYRGINLSNIGSLDKNTIEFRVSNGTLDRQTIMDNIRLFGSLMMVSKEMTFYPEKYELKIRAFMNRDASERDKLEALLDLLFTDEKVRDIYRRRWDSVKESEEFDQVASKDPTFRRGDYTLEKYARKAVSEVDLSDMGKFIAIYENDKKRQEEKGSQDGFSKPRAI